VRDAQADGYAFIKVYSKLSLETFAAIVDEARTLHMRVVGTSRSGRRESRRSSSYQDSTWWHTRRNSRSTPRHRNQAAIPRYVAMAKGNGTWLIATLTWTNGSSRSSRTRDPGGA